MRVAQVPVEGDEVRHGVKNLGRLERLGRWLEGKVAHFVAGSEKAVHLLFDRLFDVAGVVGDFCWGGSGQWGGGSGRLRTVRPRRRRFRHVDEGVANCIKG